MRLLSPAAVLVAVTGARVSLTDGTASSTAGEVVDMEGEGVDMFVTMSLAGCWPAGTTTGTAVTSAAGGTGGAGTLALTV